MKNFFIVLIIILVLGVGGWLGYSKFIKSPKQAAPPASKTGNEKPMQITSKAFQNGEIIPPKYTCDGVDVNPPLEFSDIPKNTKSLALIVDDPDAASGDWVHWLVWNMSATSTGISEDSVPNEAVIGTTDFGNKAYGGPCPGSGQHRYIFKLYALDEALKLSSFSVKKDLLEAMNGHILGQAQMVGLYARSK